MKRKKPIHSFFKLVGSSANSIQAKNPNVETLNVEVETNAAPIPNSWLRPCEDRCKHEV
jgi:hypothetical protein